MKARSLLAGLLIAAGAVLAWTLAPADRGARGARPEGEPRPDASNGAEAPRSPLASPAHPAPGARSTVGTNETLPGDGGAAANPDGGAWTRLFVHHSVTGAPLEGFALAVVQGDVREDVVTNAEGSAVLAGPFVAGPARLELPREARPPLYRVFEALFPERLELAPGRDHFVTSRPSERFLEVRATDANGEPLVQRLVRLAFEETKDPDHPWSWSTREDVTNERGAGYLLLLEGDRERRLVVGLQASETERAPPLVLEPPYSSGPHTLRLVEGGTLRVRVLDDGGLPVEGARIDLRTPWPSWVAAQRRLETDARGEASAEGLLPGAWTIDPFRLPGSKLAWSGRAVDVVESAEILVELRAGEAAPEPLLAAGRVVLWDGSPGADCWLAAGDARGALDDTPTDAEGRFVLRGATDAENVELIGRHQPTYAYLEGVPLAVPVGTRDLELTVSDPALRSEVTLAFVEQTPEGREPIDGSPHVMLTMERGSAPTVHHVGYFHSVGSRVTLPLARSDTLRWLAVARGYADASGSLAELVPGRAETIEVVLTPGLARRVRVLDAESGEPIPAALFRDAEGVTLGVTDRSGWADLSSERWPRSGVLTHEEFDPVRIDFESTWASLWQIHMRRAGGDGDPSAEER